MIPETPPTAPTHEALQSSVQSIPKAYVRGALTTSDSTGGRGDGNDGGNEGGGNDSDKE